MPDRNEIVYEFTGDEDDLIRSLRNVEGELDRVTKGHHEIDVELDVESVIQSLRSVQDELRKAEGKRFGPNLNKSAKVASQTVVELKDELRELRGTTTDHTIRINADKALAVIGRIEDEIRNIPRNQPMDSEGLERGAKSAQRLDREVISLGKSMQALDKALNLPSVDGAQASLLKLGNVAATVTSFLRRLPSVIAGIGIVLTTTFIPAILAAIAALGGFVVGIGSLAAALLGTLIPAVGLAAGFMDRLNAVLEVQQLREAAQRAATVAGVSDARRNAQATQQRAQAHRAVEDAQRAEQQAVEGLAEAQRDLGEAAAQAMEEMEDAARDARDAVIDLAQAQLDIEDAALNLDQAKLDLAEFRDEMGLAGESFGDLFKKFTDVDFQFDRGALAGALGESGISKEDQIELERRILAVRQAKLDEKKATNELADSEDNLGEARQRNREFQTQGIAASETYRSALEAVADANEGVADAERNTARAIADSKTKMDTLALATTGANTAMALYREERNKLSDAEREFGDVLNRNKKRLDEALQPITDPIFRGLTDVLRRLPGLFAAVNGPMREFSRSVVAAFEPFLRTVFFDITLGFFNQFIDAAGKLAGIVGGVLTDLYVILSRIGAAALPALVGMVADVGRAFSSWREGIVNAENLRSTLAPTFEIVRIVVDSVVQAMRGLFAVFQAGSGPINDFFSFIRDGIRDFAEFAESAKGRQQIKDFFEDTLPLVKSVIKYFARWVVIIIKVVQILAPFFKFFIDMATVAGDAIIILIQLVGTVLKLLRPFFAIGSTIADGISAALNAIQDFFIDVENFIEGIVQDILSFLGIDSPSQLFIDIGRAIVRGLIRGIRMLIPALLGLMLGFIKRLVAMWASIAVRFFEIGKRIVRQLANGVRIAFMAVVAAARFVWGKVRDFFLNLLDKAKEVGKKIGGAIVAGFRLAFEGLKAIAKTAINSVIFIVNKFVKLWNSVLGKERTIDVPDFLPGPDSITLPSLKLGEINPLAKGGILAGPVFAAGEAGREAVIPLTRSVLRDLGRSIISAAAPPQVVAMATPDVGGRRFGASAPAPVPRGTVIEKQDVHLPAPPSGGVLDPRYAAVQFARELKRRGW